jgi:hypothetical protein
LTWIYIIWRLVPARVIQSMLRCHRCVYCKQITAVDADIYRSKWNRNGGYNTSVIETTIRTQPESLILPVA